MVTATMTTAEGPRSNGEGLFLHCYSRARQCCWGRRGGFQWLAELDEIRGGEPHRTERVGRQGWMHPELSSEQWRAGSRAAFGFFGLPKFIHLHHFSKPLWV